MSERTVVSPLVLTDEERANYCCTFYCDDPRSYVCNRPKDHDGDHEAWARVSETREICCYAWPQSPSSRAPSAERSPSDAQ